LFSSRRRHTRSKRDWSSDVCSSDLLIVTKDGSLDRKLAKDLNLNYRTSNISSEEYIVLEATFALKEAKHEDIKAVMDDLTFKRESKQPLEYQTCGSVFKRQQLN